MLRARTVNQKNKKKKDIDAIEMQRRLQRDANKCELAQRELYMIGYPLYEYLVQMRNCSYVSQADHAGKFG